jgi:hypothetical protein
MCTLALATEHIQDLAFLDALKSLRCWAQEKLPEPDPLVAQLNVLIQQFKEEKDRHVQGAITADEWSAFERHIGWRIAYLLYRLDPKVEVTEKDIPWEKEVGKNWKNRVDEAMAMATRNQLPFPDAERLREESRPKGHAGAIVGGIDKGPTANGGPPPSPRIPTMTDPDVDRSDYPELSHAEEMPPEAAAPVPENGGGAPQAPASSFSEGRILYAIPDRMTISQATICRVRIAHGSLADELLSADLTEAERAAARREKIRITPVMEVHLEDASGAADHFRIHAQTSTEQLVLPGELTEWSFAVTPQRPGHFALLLRVTAKVNVPGFGEKQKDISVLNRSIEVTTTATPEEETPFALQPVPDPVWDVEDEAAVIQSIQSNRLEKAIERMANFLFDKNEELHHQLILLQGRWNETHDFFLQQLITLNEWQVATQKTRMGLLALLREVSETYPPSGKGKAQDWSPTIEKLQDLPA